MRSSDSSLPDSELRARCAYIDSKAKVEGPGSWIRYWLVVVLGPILFNIFVGDTDTDTESAWMTDDNELEGITHVKENWNII